MGVSRDEALRTVQDRFNTVFAELDLTAVTRVRMEGAVLSAATTEFADRTGVAVKLTCVHLAERLPAENPR